MKDNTSFHDFNAVLLDTLEDLGKFHNIMLLCVSGGDYVKDVVMEIRYKEKKYRYSPYELYLQGKKNNNYEEVIEIFIEEILRELK